MSSFPFFSVKHSFDMRMHAGLAPLLVPGPLYGKASIHAKSSRTRTDLHESKAIISIVVSARTKYGTPTCAGFLLQLGGRARGQEPRLRRTNHSFAMIHFRLGVRERKRMFDVMRRETGERERSINR